MTQPSQRPPKPAPAAAPAPQPLAPPAKRPFPYQAASASFWFPFLAIFFISIGANSSAVQNSTASGDARMHQWASLIVAVVNSILLLASLIFGFIALAAIPRLGRKELLGRALAGVIISSLFIAAAVYLIFFLRSVPQNIENRIAGDWDCTALIAGSKTHVQLSLNPNRTARLQFLDGPRPIDAPGIWHVILPGGAKSPGILELKFDTPLNLGHSIPVLSWQLDHVTDTQLDLLTNDASGAPIHEFYSRHH